MSQAQDGTFSYEDGARAVELARTAVRSFVQNGKREHPGSMRDAFYTRSGAFVRLESTRGRGSLRGCAGNHAVDERIGHTIVEQAIQAASDGSCGSAVTPAELSSITISVSLVTDSTETTDPVDAIEIGSTGVVIPGYPDAWLYPTVPVDQRWTPTEYLDRTCHKAGLDPGVWRDEETSVIVFDAQVFQEREPGGSIREL